MRLNKILSTFFSIVTFLSLSSSVLAAQTLGGAGPHPSMGSAFMSMLPMLVMIIAVFYFLIIRPQSKRAKDHKQLMDNLNVGDEVSTTAGIVAKVSALYDNHVSIVISGDTKMTVQRSAIAAILPKGTLDTIK